ncbi:MAG TPA: hypothetical protein DDX99_11610 [Desulfofustis sp.]|nr:hypothetical protein [Desulfofustis sp.]HBH31539.1 hypothetical protein [Desulfofustis sp.]
MGTLRNGLFSHPLSYSRNFIPGISAGPAPKFSLRLDGERKFSFFTAPLHDKAFADKVFD